MKLEAGPVLLGSIAALLVGFSKTGVPGAGIPAVALMAEAYRDDARLAVGAILPLLILGDLFAVAHYRRYTDWRRLWQLVPFVVVGMVPGYLVLWQIDSRTLRVLIGMIILALLVIQVTRRRFGWDQFSERIWFVAGAGILAGFATTVSNAAGPVMSIYLVSKRLDKLQFLGTTAWFFLLMNLSKIPLYSVLGMITPATLGFNLALVPAVVVGALVGARVLRLVPQSVFNWLVLVLAGLAAARMVLD